jgi:hypothetical protein
MSLRSLPWTVCPVLAALVVVVVAGGGNTSVPPVAGTEMTLAERATVRGQLTLEGPAPDVAALNRAFREARTHGPDRDAGRRAPPEEHEDQRWRISAEGGVGNVVVWLRPADGSSFVMQTEDLHPRTRTWPQEVLIVQRHLNYSPHVCVLFPSHYDPVKKKQVATGQVFRITNDAIVCCNAHVMGGPENPGVNVLLKPDEDVKVATHPETRPLLICDAVHPWMSGYAWAFDHPYAAVTDRNGRYEIRNVPADRALRLVAWHEDVGYLHGRDGIAVELKNGPNRKDLRVRANR